MTFLSFMSKMKFTVNCTSSSTAFIFYNAPGTLSLVVRGNLVPWVSTEMKIRKPSTSNNIKFFFDNELVCLVFTLILNVLLYLYWFLFLRLDLQVLSFGSYFDMAEERNS